jgi:pimeloyl-ACP methyl ester carboxylesterase
VALVHLEHEWEHPLPARFFQRLSSFSRLIRFDKRGTRLSDRAVEIPTLEQRMDDVRAVMVGSQRAALSGVSEGGPMSVLFAATYPERTARLVLYGSYARRSWAPDHPFGWTEEQWSVALERLERDWGTPGCHEMAVPSMVQDEGFRQYRANYQRLAASPGAAAAVWRMNITLAQRELLRASWEQPPL